MSDYDFDDDEFDVDDSFLREVDSLEATVTTQPTSDNRPAKYHALASRPSAGPSRPSVSGSSRQRRATPPVPDSDDYDDFSLPSESLLAMSTPDVARTAPRSNQSAVIPSSRLGMGRVPSANAANPFFQTHLNFRRENQTTKGKTWDRTAFAESGRRISADKAKKKGKKPVRGAWAKDDDETDGSEEDEGEFEPLVAPPKPLIDMTAPYGPQRHVTLEATVGNYIYPTNRPKRDYQYEIVRACFTDNCLVALPTGLGKTFVAGVVMLNFYRWFPTGKIVFLAPTKPLVNQQIEACQMTCGIPSADAAVMTGASVSAKERAKMWNERRVFYCTPQTLDNDLKSGAIDPRDIVLAVFDEAHKASGSYAYTTILAFLTAHHPYFRVLALTATPGADVPRVQAVVDALHISRIEIREAEAPEIRKYMNEKKTEKHVVLMGDIIETFRDRWATLMKPYIVKLVEKDILNDRDLDAKRLRPFRLTAKRMEIGRDRNSGLRWAMGSLTSLEKMARAMGLLLEFSIGMFCTTLQDIATGTTASGKKSTTKGNSTALKNNFEFQKLLRDVETETNMIRAGMKGKTKADKHPKMQKTLELLLEHFTNAEDEEKQFGTKNDTRAMVFCSFRECVMEVVDMLNEQSGLIRATKFVGQTQGKAEGDKGFNQKEQKKTIAEFKEGKYNVLVSTSIGEEGLDIGEVDFVVIYDMPKQSIKLLQRVGRTGRKRDGKVHVLMSEIREDTNWETAQQTHREIQEEILHSRNLELFEDVERLLPPGKLPQCVEQEMPVDPWDPQDQKRKRKLPSAKNDEGGDGKPKRAKAGPKEKKQRGHEIPEDGHDGFKSVADLLRDAGKMPEVSPGGKTPAASSKSRGKGKGREKLELSPIRSLPSFSEEEELEDISTIFAKIEEGKSSGRSGHTDSNATISRSSETKVQTATTSKRKTRSPPRNIARQATYPAVSVLSSGEEISDHDSKSARSSKPAIKPVRGPKKLKKRTMYSDDDDVSEDMVVPYHAEEETLGASGSKGYPDHAKDFGAIEDEPTSVIPDVSPLDFLAPSVGPVRRARSIHRTPPSSPEQLFSPLPSPPREIVTKDIVTEIIPNSSPPGNRLSPRTAALAGFSQLDHVDLSWTGDDDFDIPPSAQAPPALPNTSSPRSSPPPRISSGIPLLTGSRPRIMGISRAKLGTPMTKTKSTDIMPPPPIPSHRSSPIATPFPVRRAGATRKKTVVIMHSSEERPVRTVDDLSVEESPVAARAGRLKRRSREDSDDERKAGVRKQVRKAKDQVKRGKLVKPFIDIDAEISGSDASSDEPSSDHETESDRRFAGMEFAPTQAPKGYNQRAMYMAGLSTQAAPRAGLAFDKRRCDDQPGFLAKARKPVLLTDSEGEENSENEYEMGSFVVDDDDVDFDTQTHSDALSYS